MDIALKYFPYRDDVLIIHPGFALSIKLSLLSHKNLDKMSIGILHL